MSKHKEILRQSGLYSFGTQIAQLITLIAAICSRRFLGPAQTGIWATLQILVDYSKYSTLGTMDAVSREIPYRIGKGEIETADKIKNLAATFVFAGSFLMAGALLAFAFITKGRFRPEITYGLMWISGLIILQRLNNLLIALLRCYKRFEIEARLMIVSALVNAVLVAGFSYYFKIYGFIWAMMLSFVFNIVFVRAQYPFRFKWNFDPVMLKPLVTFGLPLMVLGLGMTLFRSLDKIMIAKFLGFEALGWYSIALMAVSYISNFPISVGIVLLPHFQEKYGLTNNPRDLESYLMKSSRAMALSMPLMLAAVWQIAPYGIEIFLKKFISGIPSMKILTLGMFFMALSQIYYDALVNIKKHLLLFPVLVFSGLSTFLLDFAVIRAGGGIQGVATATTAGLFIYFCLVYALAVFYFSHWKTGLREFFFFLSCFLYLVLAMTGLENVHSSGFALLGIKLAGLLAFSLPLIALLNREFQLIALILKKFHKAA